MKTMDMMISEMEWLYNDLLYMKEITQLYMKQLNTLAFRTSNAKEEFVKTKHAIRDTLIALEYDRVNDFSNNADVNTSLTALKEYAESEIIAAETLMLRCDNDTLSLNDIAIYNKKVDVTLKQDVINKLNVAQNCRYGEDNNTETNKLKRIGNLFTIEKVGICFCVIAIIIMFILGIAVIRMMWR